MLRPRLLRIRHGQPFERQGCECGQPRIELLRVDEQLVERCDRASVLECRLARALRLFVIAPEARAPCLGFVDHDADLFGQVVECAFLLGLEQRCECLDTRRQMTAQQTVDQVVHLSGRQPLMFGQLAQSVTALDHEWAIEEQLARRWRNDSLELALRALAGGAEIADGIELGPAPVEKAALGGGKMFDVP